MKLCIEEADLQKDRETLIRLLDENRDYTVTDNRYEWLYLNNPAGRACAWLLKDAEKSSFVGASAAIPRRMWVNGEIMDCFVLSDFSIDPNYRTLGPAVKLNRASVDPVLSGSTPFAYDFPSEKMAVVHRWIKARLLGTAVRMVKPLRVEPFLSKKTGLPLLPKLAGLAGDFLLLHRLSLTMDKGYTAECHEVGIETFNDDFSRLDHELGPQFPVCGVRDREYLVWRYAQNPLRRYHVVGLKKDGQHAGHGIFSLNEQRRITVYDMYAGKDLFVRKNLVRGLVRAGVELKADALEVVLFDKDPWMGLLEEFRFSKRSEQAQVFVFIPEKSRLAGIVDNPGNWHLFQGDRDT